MIDNTPAGKTRQREEVERLECDYRSKLELLRHTVPNEVLKTIVKGIMVTFNDAYNQLEVLAAAK